MTFCMGHLAVRAAGTITFGTPELHFVNVQSAAVGAFLISVTEPPGHARRMESVFLLCHGFIYMLIVVNGLMLTKVPVHLNRKPPDNTCQRTPTVVRGLNRRAMGTRAG